MFLDVTGVYHSTESAVGAKTVEEMMLQEEIRQ